MLHCFFNWFFEFVVRSGIVDLVDGIFAAIDGLLLLQGHLLSILELLHSRLFLIVEIENEIEYGLIFAIFADDLIGWLVLANLSHIHI